MITYSSLSNIIVMTVTIISLLCCCLQLVNAIKNPEEFVSITTGTFTDGQSFSTGNTLPLISVPWGFNNWAPQTQDGSRYSTSWWFSGNMHFLKWMRCTHQPSPWIGDYAWFLFMPQLGELTRNPSVMYNPRASTMKPYEFDATTAPHGTRIQLTPTNHGAILKVTYASYIPDRIVHVCFAEGESMAGGDVDGHKGIIGTSTRVSQDKIPVINFAMHWIAVSKSANEVINSDDMVCFKYKISDLEVDKDPRSSSQGGYIATVHIATSLISKDQAKRNYDQEVSVDKVTYEQGYKQAKGIWNALLSRADVLEEGDVSTHLTDDMSKKLTVFYSSLYRALLFPRRLDEVNENGEVVHYSPYHNRGGVHPGPLCTDNGFWDTFRTVYPLLSLLYPDYLGDIIQGWLNAYKEGGWLPSWASPGYRNCMAGTYADVVVADAIVKNIKGFDRNTAINAIKKDAIEPGPVFAAGAAGKDGLATYNELGYIPFSANTMDSVSRTIDYSFSDFSTSKALERLSRSKDQQDRKDQLATDARKLLHRAKKSALILFDERSGLMKAKFPPGHEGFAGFNSITWGNGYMEGNAWHHSFPPFVVDELAELHGGKDKMVAKLEALLNQKGDFGFGSYGQEIHEMTEAKAMAMGQYAHNNQPVHHILFLFALLGRPEKTQKYVRTVLNRAYGVDFYAGDEDNGEMGAWFVLGALGLYSVAPGTPDYVLSSPIFKHVRIYRGGRDKYLKYDVPRSVLRLEEFQAFEEDSELKAQINDLAPNRYLDIRAPFTSKDDIFVSKVTFKSNELNSVVEDKIGATISDEKFRYGGELVFTNEGHEKDVIPSLKSSSSSSGSTSSSGSSGGSSSSSNNNNINNNSNDINKAKISNSIDTSSNKAPIDQSILLKSKDAKIALLESQLKSLLLSSKPVSTGSKDVGAAGDWTDLSPKFQHATVNAIIDDDIEIERKKYEKPSTGLYVLLVLLLLMSAWMGARLIDALGLSSTKSGFGGSISSKLGTSDLPLSGSSTSASPATWRKSAALMV